MASAQRGVVWSIGRGLDVTRPTDDERTHNENRSSKFVINDDHQAGTTYPVNLLTLQVLEWSSLDWLRSVEIVTNDKLGT